MFSIADKLISGVFLIVSLEALYAIAWQTRARFTGDETFLFDPFAVFFVGLVSFLLWTFRKVLKKLASNIRLYLARGSDLWWLAIVLGGGIVLRLVYGAIFSTVPSSDGATYLSLANDILHGRPYEIAGNHAYWPPGYPFFMVVWLSIFSQKVAVLVSNLFLFIVTGIFLYLPIKKFFCDNSARLAIVLLSIWPNLVASSSGPAKENLLIALIALITWIISKNERKFSYLFVGILLGFASLVQPGLMLLWVAIPICLLLTRQSVKHTFVMTIFVVLGMIIVISPWTYRNYKVLGHPVSITTNGGSNFYRVNNPLADGRYQSRGELDFSNLGEVEQSKVYYDAAIQWIKKYPTEFIWLVLKKQMLWLGDDGAAFYSSLKTGGGSNSKVVYFIARAIGNVFWLGLWIVLFFVNFIPREGPSTPLEVFSKLGILYLFCIHSFFESAPKYHMPVSSLMLVLAVYYLFPHKKSGAYVES